MVPVARLELARGFPLRILSPVCLPIPSHRRATVGFLTMKSIQPSVAFDSSQCELFFQFSPTKKHLHSIN